MRRLIRSIVIFTFVMVATITFNRVEVRAAGYDPETGIIDLTGCGGLTEDEWRAAHDAMVEKEMAEQWAEEEAAQSSSSSSSSTNSPAAKSTESTELTEEAVPEYTDEEIEAAWDESDRTEATCTSEGVITYTNSITGETKTEVISVLSHTEGEPEITKEAGMFSEGTQTISCSECGELISTETIPQTCPLPLSVVVAICAGAIVLIIGIFFLFKSKK